MRITELIKYLEEMKEIYGAHMEVKILESANHWVPDAIQSKIHGVYWFPPRVNQASVDSDGFIAITKKIS